MAVSFAALLDHKVHILRSISTGTEDDEGHQTTTNAVGQEFSAAIQPRSAREVALSTQDGAVIGTHVIYVEPRVLTGGDVIIHDTVLCPKADAVDMPDGRFEIVGIRNATGRGHHLEIDAQSIGTQGGVEGS
jgi:hypothetical protein